MNLTRLLTQKSALQHSRLETLPLAPNAEGEALFEEALQELNRKVNPYWHAWRPTDMVIWDNHRVLHGVEGCDPQYERRMQRTTIAGDYGLGRMEIEGAPPPVGMDL